MDQDLEAEPELRRRVARHAVLHDRKRRHRVRLDRAGRKQMPDLVAAQR